METKSVDSETINYCRVRGCRYKHSHVTSGHRCGKCNKNGHGQVECNNTTLIEHLEHFADNVLPNDKHCTMEECYNRNLHTTRAHHCEYFNCGENHSITECPLIINVKQIILNYDITCPLCRKDNTISSNYVKIKGNDTKCSICYTNNVEVYFPSCGHVCVCHTCLQKLNKNDEINNKNGNIKSESDLNSDVIERANKVLCDYAGKIYTMTYAGMGCTWYIKREDMREELCAFFMHSDCWGQYGAGAGADDRPALYRFIHGYKRVLDTC